MRLTLLFLLSATIILQGQQTVVCGLWKDSGLQFHLYHVNTYTGQSVMNNTPVVSFIKIGGTSVLNPLTNQYIFCGSNGLGFLDRYITVDAATGALVSDTPCTMVAKHAQINPQTGVIYGLHSSNGGPFSFVTPDPQTGQVTTISNLPFGIVVDGTSVFNPIANQYIVCGRTSFFDVERYYSIDAASGIVVSDTPCTVVVKQAQINPQTGVIYGLHSSDGGAFSFVSVDSQTGEVDTLSNLPIGIVLDGTSVFNPITNQYIVCGRTSFLDVERYFTIDAATGGVVNSVPATDIVNEPKFLSSVSRVEQALFTSEINVYPNPFSQKLSFRLNNNQPASVSVYNATGQVLIYQYFSETFSINTHQWPQGIYNYLIQHSSGEVNKGKVIK